MFVTNLPWSECLVPASPPPPEMASSVRRAMGGVVPNWLERLALCPWLVRGFTLIPNKPWAYAPAELWDLIFLVISQDNSCRYCYGVQRSLMRIHGYDEATLGRLERDLTLADLSPSARAALDFARKLSRADPRPGRGDYAALERAGLGAPARAEIAFAVAAVNFSNRTSTLLSLPPATDLETLVERPIFRVLRPLMAWRMRERPRRPLPLALPNTGFGTRLVAALGDSPSATSLRQVLDDALASDILPRRTKMMLFAVIAKALRCASTEAEARAALVAEGVSAATIDDVLVHLGSPELDAREAVLVPFARDTVRYQQAAIQRRTREVTAGMTAPELLELVGVVALANAVCRLSSLCDLA
jgi:alkylhydroperoxidase family enzyme